MYGASTTTPLGAVHMTTPLNQNHSPMIPHPPQSQPHPTGYPYPFTLAQGQSMSYPQTMAYQHPPVPGIYGMNSASQAGYPQYPPTGPSYPPNQQHY